MTEHVPIEAAQADLAANADARANLRRRVDRSEIRLAARNLLEGARGLVRSAPLLCVAAGVGLGMALSRRRRVRR